MNFILYNIVVAAYPVFVYVVSRAGRQVDSAGRQVDPAQETTYTNTGYAATTIL